MPAPFAALVLENAMIVVRDPILQPISITDLRPTQMTVGMR
jgi:hypothetical protein